VAASSLPFQSRRARARRALFFFYSIKFRIAGSEEKTANFPGVEVLIYEHLLLWISGGNLTRKAEFGVQGFGVWG
jgi:hypothetical protein